MNTTYFNVGDKLQALVVSGSNHRWCDVTVKQKGHDWLYVTIIGSSFAVYIHDSKNIRKLA